MTSSNQVPERAADVAGAPRRPLPWWVAGITFVVGFVFGVIAVGLLSASTPGFPTGARPGADTARNPPVPQTPGGGPSVAAEARVNAACLAVINEAQDIFTVLTGVDEAVADIDLQHLDDIVRRLQPINARLGRDLQECRVDTGIATGPTGSANTQPTIPQPTAKATR
jgi:hypothetical protein